MTDTAKVVNGHTLRNWADAYLIGHTMGSALAGIMPELPVPAIYNLRHPRPAFVRCTDIYFSPEAFVRGIIQEYLKRLLSGVMRRAVSAVPSPLIVT